MKVLVDTHIFLWVLFSPKRIPRRTKDLLQNSEFTYVISIISLWEITIKYSLGKIDLSGVTPDDLYKRAKQSGFDVLGLDPDVVCSFYKLPRGKNKDPFDRMLAWQAIAEDYILLTCDKGLFGYKSNGLKILS